VSEPASTEPGAAPRAASRWRLREASGEDVAAVAAAVGELLAELGGRQPAAPELEAEARALLDDSEAGSLLVAEADGEIVGVLVANWLRAIHVPGRYALIQDLWVDRDWRSQAIGAELVAALAALARERGVGRIEVGLPRESFAAIAATTAFYSRNGFEPLGPRMRLLLS
jgi:branched-chain amino acid aminotransferase